ncbi:MAG: NAD(P)H-hydrate dehydratase [Candidatus Omnitrophica bacterium]|nr:NAD(P)H-hydrate dehydratase [Candidatus Omnitrophota bacterium]
MNDFAKTVQEFQKAFPAREKAAHKGDFGRVFILAGSRGLVGAGLLAGIGALRSGAGLISLGTPEECAGMILAKIPEVMVKPLPETSEGSLAAKAYDAIKKYLKNQDVFALGPGLSQNENTQQLIRQLVEESEIPMVIDADGLNAFQDFNDQLKDLKVPVILTPHPGEFKRLFEIKVSDKEKDRVSAAGQIAKEFGLTVVLKGAGTVVAAKDGRVFVNPTGNPGMAKGGTGDILCGIIASFVARKLDAFDAARFGAFVHGYAADLAVKDFDEVSLTPGDILNYLPKAFLQLLGRE